MCYINNFRVLLIPIDPYLVQHVDFGIIFLCIGHSQRCLYNSQSKSDWLFYPQSEGLQFHWLMLEKKVKATLSINMSFCIEH